MAASPATTRPPAPAGPIEAELFDGTILEFPAGTAMEVIQRVAREQTALRRQSQDPQGSSPGNPFAAELERRRSAGQPGTAGAGGKMVEFEGQLYEFPADATDAEIMEMLDRESPWTPPAPSLDMEGPADASPEDLANLLNPSNRMTAAERALPFESAEPRAPADPGRQLMLGTHATGRGLARAAGLLPDLAAMGLNVGLAGADLAAEQVGGSVPYRFDLPSDNLIAAAGGAAEELGLPLATPETFGERAMGTGLELATEGATLGGTLVAAGARRLQQLAGRGATPRIGDALIRPYADNPGRVLAGDAAAGAGAGGALATSREYVPDEVREAGGGAAGALIDLGAMLAGGVSTVGAIEGATRAPSTVAGTVRRALPARDVPFDPETGLPVSNRLADLAAGQVQREAIDPAAAAETILRRAGENRAEGLPVPTSGMISGDSGVESLERAARRSVGAGTLVRDPSAAPGTKAEFSFAERDRALQDSAVDEITGVRPAGAQPERFVARAEEIAGARRGVAAGEVDRARGRSREIETARRDAADDLGANVGRGDAASRDIDRTYRTTREQELAQSRALYNDPVLLAAEVPIAPLRQAGAELGRLDTPIAPLAPVVKDFVRRFQQIPEGSMISMREANALRAELEGAIQDNMANGEVVRQLRSIKDVVSGYPRWLAQQNGPAAEAARRATQNFAERVGPNFREGAGGQFDAMLSRDRTGYATRPGDTAGVFLTRPDDAADLMRIAGLRGNEETTARAARAWLFDQLARTGVARGGAIDPGKLTRWRNINERLLEAVPGLRGEVDGMVSAAQRGAALSQDAASGLRLAEDRLADTERSIARGPLGAVSGRSPENAVAAVFGSDNPRTAMRELVGTVGRNREAGEGLKAAVADYFVNRVTRTNPSAVSDGVQAVDFANLVRQFDANARVLAEVFSPDEMNALRRAHRMLEPLTRRTGDAAVGGARRTEGPDTAMKLLEVALKGYYGILKGGGVFRTLRIAGSLGPNNVDEVNRLIARMMFDPELAAHLLTRNVAEVGTPVWNARLARLVRRTEAARELAREEGEAAP